MKKKDNTFIIMLGIATVVVACVGLTFAWFSTSMTGTNGIVTATTGKVGTITFDGGNDFTTANEIETLPWEESKTFTITVAPSSVSQTVYVWMDYTNTIPELECNVTPTDNGASGSVSLETTGTSKNSVGNSKTVKLVEKTFSASTSTQIVTYTLTMSIPETGVNQKQNLNQVFNGTLYANLGSEGTVKYYNNSNTNGTTTKPSSN